MKVKIKEPGYPHTYAAQESADYPGYYMVFFENGIKLFEKESCTICPECPLCEKKLAACFLCAGRPAIHLPNKGDCKTLIKNIKRINKDYMYLCLLFEWDQIHAKEFWDKYDS